MTDITKEIVDWLKARPEWQQVAVERLLASGALSDSDLAEITEIVKQPYTALPLSIRTFDGLTNGSSGGEDLRLVSIGDIKGIESLAPYRPLTFGTGNLAVIYGHNGSGKSGYTRILKKICGHPRAQTLRSNVFAATPIERKCTICYALGADEYPEEWPANGSVIEPLRAVDIFDSEAATFYLTSETGVTYTPPQIALFESLAAACGKVGARLQSEKNALRSALPQMPFEYSTTAIGQSYRSIRASTPMTVLNPLKSWTEEDQKTLDGLIERLKTTDPSAMARKYRQTKAQVDQLHGRMQTAAESLSAERVSEIRIARTEAQAKRQIANEAAKVGSSQLDGVGSDTWRTLWRAAREYSLAAAYPTKAFPAVDDGDRCVLCHQELAPDARQRLLDFETFVQGKVERDASDAETAYKKAMESLPHRMNDDEIKTACTAAGLDESWVQALTGFWSQLQQTTERLREGETQHPESPIAVPSEQVDALLAYSASLEASARQNEEDALKFDRPKVEADRLNLEARRWTAQQSAEIDAEVELRKQLSRYDSWVAATNPQPISLKAGQFAEQMITTAYVQRFNEELSRLGAGYIKVELVKTRTDHGVALHKLRLAGVTSSDPTPESVLSEGERRIVSLAAFLADVADKPHAAPFVFDDPISSLDGEFEWYVALRLAQLARERQVLIFTHRLSLFGAVEDAAKKVWGDDKGKHLEQRFIRSFNGSSGHPDDDEIAAAKTKKANNLLLDRLTAARQAGERDGPRAYERLAQGICTDFRKLLERTVEDDLLNEIVKRHRRSVQTDNRLGALPRITPEDCQFIDALMTDYSAFEHSQSSETPVIIPNESKLRADLEKLKAWREGFSKRDKKPMA